MSWIELAHVDFLLRISPIAASLPVAAEIATSISYWRSIRCLELIVVASVDVLTDAMPSLLPPLGSGGCRLQSML